MMTAFARYLIVRPPVFSESVSPAGKKKQENAEFQEGLPEGAAGCLSVRVVTFLDMPLAVPTEKEKQREKEQKKEKREETECATLPIKA
jgi:hypothetical protein